MLYGLCFWCHKVWVFRDEIETPTACNHCGRRNGRHYRLEAAVWAKLQQIDPHLSKWGFVDVR